MILRQQNVLFTGLLIALMACLTTSLQANDVFNDDFSDGDLAKTGATDTNWWTSSSSSGIEIDTIDEAGMPAPPSLGLVTGGSGRGIHTVFPTQTLAPGDILTASYTFVTPTTIGGGSSSSFRVGLLDTLGRVEAVTSTMPNMTNLDDNVDASSNPATGPGPNAVYGWGGAVSGPGTLTLPGFMLDMDVNTGTGADLNFRQHGFDTAFGTGRLMGTTSNWSNISPSGPDAGYEFLPNTEYTGTFSVEALAGGDVELCGTLGADSYCNITTPNSLNFGMLGFHVNSDRFGTSNSAGDVDNGIDFTNISVTVKAVPEPASFGLLSIAGLALLGLRRR
jgi:hypothetical protein